IASMVSAITAHVLVYLAFAAAVSVFVARFTTRYPLIEAPVVSTSVVVPSVSASFTVSGRYDRPCKTQTMARSLYGSSLKPAIGPSPSSGLCP
ncbi:hypothetical protein Gpo141_00013010, partial [Globisporangium polare]